MPQVFDRETGQPVNVSPEEAQAGLVSGKLAFDADAGPVVLKGAGGKTFTADPDKAVQALSTGAYAILDPHEELVHHVRQQEAARGVEGSVSEGLASGANQLLLGIPGAITEATETPQEREKREAAEDYHHAARVLGGAVGVGASLLAGGGGVFKAADLAGQAVERGVMPAAELAEASLARRLAGTAANYATQGAVLSSPQALIQATIGGDPKKAAETLAWGIGAGALLGVGAGALHEAAGAALEKVGESLGSADASGRLEDYANARTAKAFGAERSQLNKLSKERIGEVADFAHEEGLIEPGLSRAEIGDRVHLAHEKFGQKIGEVVDSLDEVMKRGSATEDMVAHAMKPGELGDAIKSALDSPELRMPMNADQARALDMVVESANRIPTTLVNGREVVSFEKAQSFVSDLRKKWVASISRDLNEGGVRGMDVVTPLDQMKNASYQVARDALHGVADRVAAASDNPELVGALASAKKDYSKVAELEKWVATRERQEAGNRAVGLTDFLHMGHGIPSTVLGAAGAGLGGLVGGPAGALIGAGVTKPFGIALDYLAKHWMEDKGLVYLSTIAKKAAKEGPEVFSAVLASEGAKRLEATMSGVRDTVKSLAIRGVEETKARTHEHMQHLLGTTTGLSHDQQYAKLERRLTDLASNPAALASATAAASAPFAAGSPQLGDAYQQQMMRTLNYLYAALPKPSATPMPFAPNDFAPSPAAKMEFRDKAEIVANPMKAMDHMRRGTLSAAHLDALQTVYPGVYSQMQQEVLRFAGEHPEVKLPYAERRMVGKFLGAPVDGMSPHLAALQASYAGQKPGPQGGPPQGKPMAKGKLGKLPALASSFSATQGPAPQGAA